MIFTFVSERRRIFSIRRDRLETMSVCFDESSWFSILIYPRRVRASDAAFPSLLLYNVFSKY